jgi:phage gp36-like protein
MKQTAVEFLIEQFKIPNSDSYISKTFQQALEMEKQQIIDAYLQKRRISNISKCMKLCVDAEKYYNETYKKP